MVGLDLALLIATLTSAPAAGEPPPPAPRSIKLERGIALLEEDRFEAAIEMLESIEGGLGYDDVRRLKQSLGVALAFADRKDEARRIFRELLAIAPDHALPHTISPKATFVFEEARTEMAQERAIEAELTTPLAIPLDQPFDVTLVNRANPFRLAQRWQICFRLKRAHVDYQCRDVGDLPLDQPRVVALPAVSTESAGGQAAARPGAPIVLQLAVYGYDRAGNEVYRDPTRTRPKEILIGVDAPTPWYAHWWLWATVGVAAVVASAAIATAVYLGQPTTAQLTGELAP